MKSLPLRQQLYVLQLLEYQPWRYLLWWLHNLKRFRIERKKQLVWTGKARFLFFGSLFLNIFISLYLYLSFSAFPLSVIYPLSSVLIFSAFPTPLLLLTLLILKPYEIINRNRTLHQTRRLLQNHPHLTIIGVTGSYGKTSVKDILARTLSLKYKVLATPQSYNTLFGIANFVKEKLKAEHEILIVEMGAYKIGEIRELCQMVPPQIGVITGLTSQHLERFGSLENITTAKYELIEALPPNGLAVFNLDSEPVKALYDKTTIKKIGYSQNVPADITTSINNETTQQNNNAFSTTFTLNIRSSQSSHSPILPFSHSPIPNLQLNLPGRYQVSNALAAIAVALHLGLTPEEIRGGLAKIQPSAHRLQITATAQNVTIIDDAYSSNPEGVKAAINLVSQFSNSPKIIVTPGMVELGPVQEEENINLGKMISANFDYAVIVNKTNRQALLKGLLERSTSETRWLLAKQGASLANGKENKKIFIADSLDQAAKQILPRLVKPNSLILFENDLPDIYQ